MADPRFFGVAGPFSLQQLAQIAQADIAGNAADADPQRQFVDVAPLDRAGPEDVSFLDNRAYVDAFTRSRAGACLVHPNLAGRAPAGMITLVTPEPYQAYARVAAAFYPEPAIEAGISETAHVAADAVLGEGCRVEPGAVIGAAAEIGAGSRIGANSVIGSGVVLGRACVVAPNVTISHCLAGDRLIVHGGVRIGQDGFGFALGGQGHQKVAQLGRVVIGDDVEIGANTTIDRGAGPDTVIGAGCKIDNLVQIGHNVRLGRGCVVVSQVGISGSTQIGDFVMIGGQAGLAGHLTIGSGARIAAQSGLMRDVPPGGVVAGSPASPAKEHWRQMAILAKMAKKDGN